MAVTPKRLVHWQMETPSFSNLNSPFFDGTSESSMVSTSSLEYINGQLVAHGFVPSPGLCLDGISNDDSTRVVKCLLGMLGQRVEDMNRTEDLTTKYRTLSYDHERMRSMYRSATEKAANAEREMNLHKTRLAASLKTLQASEASHKLTTAELQRTRTLLQGVRATHHAELKKREKEIERVMEKWQRIADSQTKISAAQSGLMYCANAAVLDGSEVIGKGLGFLEIALEQAEKARDHLSDENLFLRKLVLRTVNELQSVLYQAQCKMSSDQVIEEPVPLTQTTLFPLAPQSAPSDKMDTVISVLRDALSTLSQPQSLATTTTMKPPIQVQDGEIERLQTVIAKLKEELACSQKQSMAHVIETQAMFDKFAEDHRIATGEIGEMSVELMTSPLKDEEKQRLDDLRKELDSERQRFTDAAIKFGKEKAALEAERIRFLDEKRSWEVEKMLSDLPPTPAPAFKMPSSPKKSPHKSPHKSPRQSPAKKMNVGKIGNGNGRKAHRVSKRSLASPVKVISYETELIPPLPAPSFASLKPMASLASSLLPTSFVLPPPSPRASFPTKPALPSPPHDSSPDDNNESNRTPDYSPPIFEVSPPPETATSNTETTITNSSNKLLATPAAARRPFPVAKPFAQRMIHAYSPAKPSPLSRILMLSDSPLTPPNGFLDIDTSLSPTSGPLAAISEDDSLEDALGIIPPRAQTPEPQMSLAAQLGVSESPPDIPLQENKVGPNVVTPATRGGRVLFPDHVHPKKQHQQTAAFTVAEKGKAKASEPPAPRAKSSVVGEKENSNFKQRVLSVKMGVAGTGGTGSGVGGTRKVSPVGGMAKPPVKTASKSATAASTTVTSATVSRAKPPSKTVTVVASMNGGGARRVPINSVDAPPIGKGWKG